MANDNKPTYSKAAARLKDICGQIRSVGAAVGNPRLLASVSGHDIWTGHAFEMPVAVNSNIDHCLDLVRRSAVRVHRPRRNVRGNFVLLDHNSRLVPKD